MNDETLNRLIAVSFLILVTFTAGIFLSFHFTIKRQLEGEVLDAKLETSFWKLENAILMYEYTVLENKYELLLYSRGFPSEVYVFKDYEENITHVTQSIYKSKNDTRAIQVALDNARVVRIRGTFIIDAPLTIPVDDVLLDGGHFRVKEGVHPGLRVYNVSNVRIQDTNWYYPFNSTEVTK